MGLVQTGLLFQGASAQLYLVGGSFLVGGLLVGLALLQRIGDTVWLKRGIGMALLVFAIDRARALITRSRGVGFPGPALGVVPDMRKPSALVSVVLCFTASGFVGGLTAVMGPPLMLFVALHEKNLSMQTWRSTGACIRLTLASVRLVFWVHVGSVDLEDRRLRSVIAASVAAALCGLTFGNLANRHLNPAHVPWLVDRQSSTEILSSDAIPTLFATHHPSPAQTLDEETSDPDDEYLSPTDRTVVLRELPPVNSQAAILKRARIRKHVRKDPEDR